MKRYYIAAATLLLGTSAFAWAPSTAPVADSAEDKMAISMAKGAEMPAFGMTPKSDDMSGDEHKLMVHESSWSGIEGEPKLIPASAVTWEDEDALAEADAMAAGDPDLDLAETSIETSQDETDLALAAEQSDPALGYPLETSEPVVTTADTSIVAADLTPRPAAGNYPPCEPGPGDDNCIQLYEPGVRTALASWTAPTGGLGDGTTATAMGGPIEEFEGSTETSMAMNGDHLVDASLGEAAQDEYAAAAADAHAGVGGPIAEDGYPPCAPGPGDDRCIQLYEPGVTGAGN